MTQVDGRINNKPPVRKPSLSLEDVATIDYLIHELGARQWKVAERLGCSKVTVMSAIGRKKAYAHIPPYTPTPPIPNE